MGKGVRVHFNWTGAQRVLILFGVPWYLLFGWCCYQDSLTGKVAPPEWILFGLAVPFIALGLYCASCFLVALASEPDPPAPPARPYDDDEDDFSDGALAHSDAQSQLPPPAKRSGKPDSEHPGRRR